MDIKKLPPTLLAALGFGVASAPACEAAACLNVASDASGGPSTGSTDDTSTSACLSLPPETTSGSGSTTSSATTGSTGSTGTDTDETSLSGCLSPPLTTTGTDTGTGTGTDTDTDTDTGGSESSTGGMGAADQSAVLERVLGRGVLPADVAAKLSDK